MRRFKLDRIERNCVVDGLKVVNHPNYPDGRLKLTQVIGVEFEVGKVSIVEDDELNLSHAVDSRLIVQLPDVVEEEVEVEEPVVDEIEDEVEEINEGDDSVLDKVYDPFGVRVTVTTEEDNVDCYEELDDGKFRCLICAKDGIDKILKQEARMKNHVRDKH